MTTQSSKERIMHSTVRGFVNGRSLLDRYRSGLMTLVVAVCAATVLSISAAAAPASAEFHAEAYNDPDHPFNSGFKCPVRTVVDGGLRHHWDDGHDIKKLQLTTAITTGYNGNVFAACRASVYVDVLDPEGGVMGTLAYFPWAGPLSTNFEKHDDIEVPLPADKLYLVRSINIRQYPRYR
jgi:hypothetical protein